MSMYSHRCVAAVGVAMCVSCCFILSDTRAMTSAVITDNDTDRITNIIIIMKIMTTTDVNSVVAVVAVM